MNTSISADRQAVNSDRAQARPHAEQGPRDHTKPGGFVMATDDFLDVRMEPEKPTESRKPERLTPIERLVFQNVELFAQQSCFSFPSTATLSKRCNRKIRSIQLILDSLQAKHWILQVMKVEGRETRLCILLLNRSNKDRPVYSPGRDDLDEIVGVVCARRRIPKCKYGTKLCRAMGANPCAHHGRKSLRPPWAQKLAPESEESCRRGTPKENPEGTGISIPQRHDPEPDPRPIPHAEAIAPAQAIPEPAPAPIAAPIPEDATAGQREFLALLDAAMLAAFLSLDTTKQAAMLAPHRIGFDRVIAADAMMKLRPRIPVPPPAPPPQDPLELFAALPGADPHWASLAAEDLARSFGSDLDRKLWGEFNLIAEAVRTGRAEAEALVHCYCYAIGPNVRNHGAAFWRAWKDKTGLDSDGLRGVLS